MERITLWTHIHVYKIFKHTTLLFDIVKHHTTLLVLSNIHFFLIAALNKLFTVMLRHLSVHHRHENASHRRVSKSAKQCGNYNDYQLD